MKRMSKSTHSRKKKSTKLVVLKIFLFLFLFDLLFVAFYSYGAVSTDDLEEHAVEIVDIVYHRRNGGKYGGKHWLSFLTSDGEEFYCRIEGPNRSTIYELKNAVLPVSAKVSYGKPVLLPAYFTTYDGRHRLATLEVDGNRIIDLEHYNAVNSEYRVGFIIAAAMCLLVSTFPYWYFWIIWIIQLINARKE